MAKYFSLAFTSAILLTGCFSNSNEPEKLKNEIGSFAKMSSKEVAGEMHDRDWIDSFDPKTDIVTYSESKIEAGDNQDYYQFWKNTPGKFLIALDRKSDYEGFLQLIDTCKVEGVKCEGCIGEDKDCYQLSDKCYICAEGFDDKKKRFIIRVSRSKDFSVPKKSDKDNKSPKQEAERKNVDRVFRDSYGNEVTVYKDKSSIIKHPDGTVISVHKDGVRVFQYPDGTIKVFAPAKKMFDDENDGTQ